MIDAFHAGYGAVVHDIITAVVVTCGRQAASACAPHGFGTVLSTPARAGGCCTTRRLCCTRAFTRRSTSISG
jgi:hypothetical protein